MPAKAKKKNKRPPGKPGQRPSVPDCNAKRPTGKPGRRPSVPDYNAQLWTTPMARKWSGLSQEQLAALIAGGEIEAVAIGPARDHTMPDGSIRHRKCAKFLVMAGPFKAFVAGLGARGRLTTVEAA